MSSTVSCSLSSLAVSSPNAAEASNISPLNASMEFPVKTPFRNPLQHPATPSPCTFPPHPTELNRRFPLPTSLATAAGYLTGRPAFIKRYRARLNPSATSASSRDTLVTKAVREHHQDSPVHSVGRQTHFRSHSLGRGGDLAIKNPSVIEEGRTVVSPTTDAAPPNGSHEDGPATPPESVRSVANGWDELDNLEDLTVRRSPRSGGGTGRGRGGARRSGGVRYQVAEELRRQHRERYQETQQGRQQGERYEAEQVPQYRERHPQQRQQQQREQQRRYAQAAPALEPEVVFGEDNEGSEEWRRAAGRVWEWIAVKSGAGASGGGGGGGGGGGAGRGAARAASALGWSFFGPVSANESFAGNHSPGSEGGFADLLLLALFRVARFFRRAAAALSAAIVAALPSTFQTTLVKPVVDGALLLSGVWLLRGLFEVTWRLGSIALLSLLPALGAMTLLSSANAPRQPHTAPFPAHQRAPPFASAPPPPPPSPPTQNRNWSPTSGFERSPNRFASTGADYRAYGDNASWSEFDGYTAGEGVGRRSGRYERWEEVRDEDLGLGYAPRRGTASSPNLAAAEISTWEEVSDEDLGLGYAPRRGTASSPNAAGTATGTVPGTDLAGLENAPERRSPAGGSENAAAAGASAVGASAGSASAATAGWASNVHSSGRPAGAPAHDAGSRPVRGEAGGPAGLGVSAHGAGSRPVRGNAGGSAGLGTPGHSVEGKSSAAGSSRRGGVVSRVVDGSGSRGMRVYECCNGTCTCAACVTPAFLQTAPGRGRAVGSVPAVDRAEQGVGAAAADMKAWDEAVVSAAPPPAAATTWDEAVPTVVATAASAPSAPFTASTAPSIIVGNHEVASGSRASGNYFPPVLNPVAPVLNPVAVSDATARLEAIRSDLKRHVAAEAAFSAPAPASAPASAVPSAVARVAFGSAAREAAFRPPPAAAAAPFASSDPVFVDNGEGRVDTQSERKPLVGLGKNSLLIADDLNVGDLNEGDDFIPLHDLHREDDLTREDDLNLNAVFLENFCEWPRRRVAVAAAAVDSRPDREGPLPVRGAAVVGRRRAVTHTDGVQPGEGRWHAQAVESMPDREGPLPVRRAAVARRRMAVTHTDGVQPGEGRWHTQPSLQSSPGGGIGERAALGGAEGRLGGYGRREELTGEASREQGGGSKSVPGVTGLGLSLDSFGLDSLGLDALGFDAWQAFMWASDRIYGSSYGDYSFHRRQGGTAGGAAGEGQAVPGTERAQQATGMQGGSFRGGQELGCDGGGVSARHMGVLPLAISQGEAQQMAGGFNTWSSSSRRGKQSEWDFDLHSMP